MKYYKIADLIVQMNLKYEPLLKQAKAYELKDAVADFVIPNITKKILEYHKENPTLSIGECEYIMYASYFYTKLLEYGGLYLHASAVVKDDLCYMFSAPSGTGKSTHTQLWLDNIEGSFILNDDKPAIRYIDGRLYAYGTPFSGKHDLSKNERYPLKAICFIERDKTNLIQPMNSNYVIPKLMEATVNVSKENRLNQNLKMFEKIIRDIPIYQMGVNMDKSAAIMSYNTMKE